MVEAFLLGVSTSVQKGLDAVVEHTLLLNGVVDTPASVGQELLRRCSQTPLHVTVTHLSFPHCFSPSLKGIGVNGAGKAGHWGGGIQDRRGFTGIGVGIIWTLRSQGHNLMGELWN